MKTIQLFACGVLAFTLTNCQTESVDSSMIDGYNSKASKSYEMDEAMKGHSVYVSSNTSGMLSIFNVQEALEMPSMKVLSLPYMDADGVEYDANRDAIYQVNRSDKALVALSNISEAMNGDVLIPTAMGPSTFENGRGSDLYNNKVVVVDDVTPGKLVSYHVNEEVISDFRQYHVGFEVWDVHVNGKDLWAIEDVSSNLVYFENFHNAKSGDLMYTAKVAIEGLVRTHGLDYDAGTDTMVLTDIGSASGMPTSASDGALIIIHDFSAKFMTAAESGMIGLDDQIRIEGDLTELGNPVDVAISTDKHAIFVAERAQQKLLIFDMPMSSGNYAPVYSSSVPGASSVTIDF
ncbi:hypothetical protein [Aestuariibaculum suncheonense]|uniref:Uncharacterized protein n=1 Tax=Aestuariibaculum suncheonense TaxID=1028745 RepID=A0A8J6QBB7_9FLAO|nr:hypothetical protein [Aestuariibaculum suncheonense]MBD0834560.1 hypothetical protein [Aestuariibaculum suncheonense]